MLESGKIKSYSGLKVGPWYEYDSNTDLAVVNEYHNGQLISSEPTSKRVGKSRQSAMELVLQHRH